MAQGMVNYAAECAGKGDSGGAALVLTQGEQVSAASAPDRLLVAGARMALMRHPAFVKDRRQAAKKAAEAADGAADEDQALLAWLARRFLELDGARATADVRKALRTSADDDARLGRFAWLAVADRAMAVHGGEWAAVEGETAMLDDASAIVLPAPAGDGAFSPAAELAADRYAWSLVLRARAQLELGQLDEAVGTASKAVSTLDASLAGSLPPPHMAPPSVKLAVAELAAVYAEMASTTGNPDAFTLADGLLRGAVGSLEAIRPQPVPALARVYETYGALTGRVDKMLSTTEQVQEKRRKTIDAAGGIGAVDLRAAMLYADADLAATPVGQ